MTPPPKGALIVLPTHHLLIDYAPASGLLELVSLTPKTVVEYYLRQWLQHQQPYAAPYLGDGPIHRYLQSIVLSDLLQSSQFDSVTKASQKGLQKALSIICDRSYFELVPMIERLMFTDSELELLEIHGWLGLDLMLQLPGVSRRRR